MCLKYWISWLQPTYGVFHRLDYRLYTIPYLSGLDSGPPMGSSIGLIILCNWRYTLVICAFHARFICSFYLPAVFYNIVIYHYKGIMSGFPIYNRNQEPDVL